MEIDFSTLTYEELIEFIFNRPVFKAHEDKWEKVETTFPPSNRPVLVEHLTRLCLEFSSLRSRFTWEQIDQGVWAMLMNPVEAVDWLMDDKVPNDLRLRCIESMYEVFAGTVAHIDSDTPMENCFFMWWDIVASRFCSSLGYRTNEVLIPNTEDARQVHDTLFNTLVRILNLDDTRSHGSALHGLGHLHHPDGAQVVQRFIETHRADAPPEAIEWAIQCRDGTVM
jgi:hypothetical protein